MNTGEITNYLRKHPQTSKVFIGCVPSDMIPVSNQYPYAVVVNTDDSSRPGTHWVALFIVSGQTAEYFDSYGDPPNKNIAMYLTNFIFVKQSNIQIQSLFSKVCGEYCIYFIVKRALGVPFKLIIESLISAKRPDELVYKKIRLRSVSL